MKPIGPESRPKLAKKARVRVDRVTGDRVLLSPERGLVLNDAGARILALLDGQRSVSEIASELARGTSVDVPAVEADVVSFLEALSARGLLESSGAVPEPLPSEARAAGDETHPYTLIAELTYRCPLKCPYCSNPVELSHAANELSTDHWERVLTDAEALGVMQVHLTGGEPLARRDLEALVARAKALDLYTNLITSGIPLTEARLDALLSAGLDNVQLSFQDANPSGSDAIAGYESFETKLTVARWVKARGLPLTMNVVLHAANIDHVAQLVALAEQISADRLELANTQYLGWALLNRQALLPTRDQIDAARKVAAEANARLRGRMELVFVMPDYFGGRPRACMDGWARRYITVSPDGLVLPCHAAHTIPGLSFESVRDRSLSEIWRSSPALDRFRGEGWMPEPCASCDRKNVDFGGCRCQAFHLTGDASATDPACELSPKHELIELARSSRSGNGRRYLFRGAPSAASQK